MSLCTVEKYRKLTGDLTNYDGDVTAALATAQTDIEDRTERKFESASRTETLVVRSNGRVYPDAYPVTAVSSPSDAVIDSPGIIVYGSADSAWPLSLSGNPGPVTQSVTYTGGLGTIPNDIQRLCAEMAQCVLAPVAPVGAPTAASTLDLEGYETPPLALLTEWPPSILRKIDRWRHVKTRLTM